MSHPIYEGDAALPMTPTSDRPVLHRPLSGATADAASRVRAAIGQPERLGVAFSGGVDSSVLLALAERELGAARTIALLGVSPSLAADERRAAHEVAARSGPRSLRSRRTKATIRRYRANGPDRCFHCKDELFTRISDEVATRYGLTAIAYGENADDALRPDRPGSRAATNHHVLRPLADAGLGKAAVRDVARALGLQNADKPAAPCLASRIPHFEEVTPAKLRQVEAAEHASGSSGSPIPAFVIMATWRVSSCPWRI